MGCNWRFLVTMMMPLAQQEWIDGATVDVSTCPEGDTIGRDMFGTDTNTIADWECIEATIGSTNIRTALHVVIDKIHPFDGDGTSEYQNWEWVELKT